MIYCVDLDGTLCTNTFGRYDEAQPLRRAIAKINFLHAEGHIIRIFSARGSGSGINWSEVTSTQLKEWGVKYHELILGKPEADFYVDDRAITAIDFFSEKDSLSDKPNEYFHNYLLSATQSMLRGSNQVHKIARAAETITSALRRGNKILWCGNGGSAADAQHLAAELVGRFAKNRDPLPSIALTTDTSILTALGNDYGYETVFARQVSALGRQGDVLVGISTSGMSTNVINALLEARSRNIETIAFTGIQTSKLSEIADICLMAQSDKTSHIQESHIAWGQVICGYAESTLFPDENSPIY